MARTVDTKDIADKGKNMADRAARSARAGVNRARNYAKETIDENESTLEDLMETGGRMISDLKDKGAEKFSETKAYAEDVVQNRPFIAIAGAFVAGAVLARIFGSSR